MVEVGRGQGWDPFYHSRGSGRRVVQGSDSVADGGSGFQCHNFTKLKHEVKKGRATKLKRKVKKGRGRDTQGSDSVADGWVYAERTLSLSICLIYVYYILYTIW
jgi:hypothetical protein